MPRKSLTFSNVGTPYVHTDILIRYVVFTVVSGGRHCCSLHARRDAVFFVFFCDFSHFYVSSLIFKVSCVIMSCLNDVLRIKKKLDQLISTDSGVSHRY